MEQQRYKFSDVFEENADGTLTPKIKINVNGVAMGPGVSFGTGATFGGVNFHQYKYHDIAGEYTEDTFHIKGFFN